MIRKWGSWGRFGCGLIAVLFLAACSLNGAPSQRGGVGAVYSGAPLAGDTRVEVGFSPGGSAQPLILAGIERARESILVAAYAFTSKPVAVALLEAHKRGVKVQVVADEKSNTGKYSAATFLANHGVPVRLNGNYAIFHHKFMVIDARHLETGSFNYSAAAASRNAENVLVLWNAPETAASYAREWRRLWNESADAPGND